MLIAVIPGNTTIHQKSLFDVVSTSFTSSYHKPQSQKVNSGCKLLPHTLVSFF